MATPGILSDIADAYRFRGKLGRLPFLIAIVCAFIIVAVGQQAIRAVCDSAGCIMTGVLILYIFQPLAIFLPSVARLADIGWPRWLAVFPLVLGFLTAPVEMINALLNDLGLIDSSIYYFSGFNLLGSGLLLYILLGLAILKGADAD